MNHVINDIYGEIHIKTYDLVQHACGYFVRNKVYDVEDSLYLDLFDHVCVRVIIDELNSAGNEI